MRAAEPKTSNVLSIVQEISPRSTPFYDPNSVLDGNVQFVSTCDVPSKTPRNVQIPPQNMRVRDTILPLEKSESKHFEDAKNAT